jgi:catechol 2,3-dioxygenase-like lactoylglutathione lyase family enzyme
MIETHLAMAVRDPEKSLRFYRDAFGAVEYYRDATTIQVQGPGPFVVLAFEKMHDEAGKVGGILHFGFRLKSPDDVDRAVHEAEMAGGKLLRRGEFAPGLPFAYIADPDGYEIEVWFE